MLFLREQLLHLCSVDNSPEERVIVSIFNCQIVFPVLTYEFGAEYFYRGLNLDRNRPNGWVFLATYLSVCYCNVW